MAAGAIIPQEDFFGLGPDSRRGDQVSFALITNRFGGNVGVRPVEPLLVGGGVELLQPNVGRGKDKLVPTIGDVFDDSTAPGLTAQPDFLRTSAFVEVNYSEPVYARKGGWYRAEFSHIADRDLDRYTYNRLDVDLRQFIPFFAERRVIALRAFASTSDVSDGNEVPFYLQPYLGGNDTMRGFREYRFRRAALASCSRANTASKSGRASTWPSSTTLARWRSAARISGSTTWRRTTDSGSASTHVKASSSASTRASGVEMANIYTSRSAAF